MDAVQEQDPKEPPLRALRRRGRPLGRHALRWGWFYASILLGHMAKEDYFPFSNWPMYANFATTATYIYAVDGHGNEIPWRTTFGQTSAPLKRQYESERDRIQRQQEVDRDEANVLGGEALITRLAHRLSADQLEAMGGSLTVHYMGVTFSDEHELEHRSKAVSVIQLDEIIAAKRAEEGGEEGGDPPATEPRDQNDADPTNDDPAGEQVDDQGDLEGEANDQSGDQGDQAEPDDPAAAALPPVTTPAMEVLA